MDHDSGQSIEPTKEVPLVAGSEFEILVRDWRKEAGSWFQIRGEAQYLHDTSRVVSIFNSHAQFIARRLDVRNRILI